MRPLAATAAACFAALATAGCGAATTGPGFSGEKQQVAAVIDDLEQAGKRRKADDICATLLTAQLRDKVAAPPATCAAEMKKAIEDADAFDLEVQAVTISGSKATARVKGTDEGDGVLRTFELVKVSGAWRIDAFGT